MNVWADAAARSRARYERTLATALAYVHENYDPHAEITGAGVIVLTLDGFDRLRAAIRTALAAPRNYLLPAVLEDVILGCRRVELITRVPGSITHRGTVKSVAGDRVTVRWDDGATSSARAQFLRTLAPGDRP